MHLTAIEVQARNRAIQATGTALRMAIGALLRDMRLAANLTQKQLAHRARKMTAGTVSQMELGTYNGSPQKLARVLTVLVQEGANANLKHLTPTRAGHLSQAYCGAGESKCRFLPG